MKLITSKVNKLKTQSTLNVSEETPAYNLNYVVLN